MLKDYLEIVSWHVVLQFLYNPFRLLVHILLRVYEQGFDLLCLCSSGSDFSLKKAIWRQTSRYLELWGDAVCHSLPPIPLWKAWGWAWRTRLCQGEMSSTSLVNHCRFVIRFTCISVHLFQELHFFVSEVDGLSCWQALNVYSVWPWIIYSQLLLLLLSYHHCAFNWEFSKTFEIIWQKHICTIALEVDIRLVQQPSWCIQTNAMKPCLMSRSKIWFFGQKGVSCCSIRDELKYSSFYNGIFGTIP